jgi:hypothetical protein
MLFIDFTAPGLMNNGALFPAFFTATVSAMHA